MLLVLVIVYALPHPIFISPNKSVPVLMILVANLDDEEFFLLSLCPSSFHGNGTALAFSSFLKLPAAGRKNLKRLIVFLWTAERGFLFIGPNNTGFSNAEADIEDLSLSCSGYLSCSEISIQPKSICVR
jgi:hypothetical protein